MNFLNNYEMNFIVIHPNNDLGSSKILKITKNTKIVKNFYFIKVYGLSISATFKKCRIYNW